LRLRPPLDEAVRRLARQTGRPAAQIINDLLDEALRSRRFPGVIFVEGPAGRRAHLAGTGLDVWKVVGLVPRLSSVRIQTAMAFAEAYPEEIEGFLQLNARAPEAVRRDFPHLEIAGR
jgi:hypothetical protein